jgi:hypothetical protein
MGDKTKELLERVHSSVVDVITKGLENGTISEDRAKEIASTVLNNLKDDITYEELIRIIPTLDDEFKELGEAVVPIMLEYEEKIRKVVNEKISLLLKNQKFNEALKLAKKALEFESELG